MARRKPDKLDLEAKAASDAGMSYGKWKAMQNPVRIEQPKTEQGRKITCAFCGKEVYRKDKRRAKYCSPLCLQRATNGSPPGTRTCPTCGKDMGCEDLRGKYCSEECRIKGYRERQKRYYAMKREKKNA